MGTDPAALRKEFNDLAKREWITWRADSNHNGRPDLSEVVPEEYWKERWNRLTATERSASIDRLFGRANLIVGRGRDFYTRLEYETDHLNILGQVPSIIKSEEENAFRFDYLAMLVGDIREKPEPEKAVYKSLLGYFFFRGALYMNPAKKGGATINPLCPLPMGESRSMIRVE